MRIAYLDTISGIAGDMALGAFVSAGLSIDELSKELKKLQLTGFELLGRHVDKNGIDAVQIEVVISHEPRTYRHLKDICSIIDESELSSGVKERSKSIFSVIAEAEAKVHDTTAEKVHFHEVGALDSLVDIVGTAICLEKFNVDQIHTSPIRLGSGGMVTTQHGIMPTPTPATVEILKNYPTVLTLIPHELTTPTGAGIVKALSTGILDEEIIRTDAIGYGAGSKDIPQIPNLLRVIIGEIEQEKEREEIVLIETNIDDMNPQMYPYLIEKTLASGAHDAYLVPIIMKKGRPGILLSVMVSNEKLDDTVNLIYSQTSTLGVRIQKIGRKKLPRREIEVQTSFGPIRAKAVMRDGKEIISPEFEECKRIAEEKGIPVLGVIHKLEEEIATRQ
jgi:uncharacterized protein (TIGR00299 family) protein